MSEKDLFAALTEDRLRLNDTEGTIRTLRQEDATNATVWPATLLVWADTEQLSACNNTDLGPIPILSSTPGMKSALVAVLLVVGLMRV